MFLGTDQLKDMVGSRVRRIQKAWLEQHSIPFTVKHNGRINVLASEVTRKHSAVPQGDNEPNLNAFKRRAA